MHYVGILFPIAGAIATFVYKIKTFPVRGGRKGGGDEGSREGEEDGNDNEKYEEEEVVEMEEDGTRVRGTREGWLGRYYDE